MPKKTKTSLTIECDFFIAQEIDETAKQLLLFIVLCLALNQCSHDISTGF